MVVDQKLEVTHERRYGADRRAGKAFRHWQTTLRALSVGRLLDEDSRPLLSPEHLSVRLTRGLSQIALALSNASCRYIPRYLIVRIGNAS
jgi:hypothetical protein